MSTLNDLLWTICRKLPTDFQPYGARDRDAADPCADCSCGCRHFVPLAGDLGADWGVCAHAASPRAGLLTFEHQGCPQFEPEPDEGAVAAEAKSPPASTLAAPLETDDLIDSEPRKKLKVDLEGLIMALEGWGSDQIQHYLDTETGEIIAVMEGDDDYDEWCEKLDADETDRYCLVEKLAGRASFEVMEQFALSLPESRSRRAVIEALARSKPFRHFKDVVHGDLALREEWFAFRDRAYAAFARDWLAGEGIELEWIDPRHRA